MNGTAKLLAAENIDTVCLNETTLETWLKAEGVLNLHAGGHYQSTRQPNWGLLVAGAGLVFDAVYIHGRQSF